MRQHVDTEEKTHRKGGMEKPAVHSVDLDSSLKFELLATDGRARATRVALRHHDCLTPMFMPVGTQGTFSPSASTPLYYDDAASSLY